jgi:hypothetical protein
MENSQRIKNLIEQSPVIKIAVPKNIGADSFPASTALFYALKKVTKEVFLTPLETPAKFKFLKEDFSFNKKTNDLVISVREIDQKIDRVFYEKTREGLKIHLRSPQGIIPKENIYFESQYPERDQKEDKYDLLIIFQEKGGSLLTEGKQLPDKKTIIIEREQNSFSEKVLDFINCLEKDVFDKKVSTHLLTGIIAENDQYQSFQNKPDLFEKIIFLINKGADYKEIIPHFYSNLGSKESLLFKRAIKKINFQGKENIACINLEDKDLQETGSSIKDLPFVLEKLKTDFLFLKNFMVTWQKANSPVVTRVVFYAEDENILGRLTARFLGKRKGKGVLFSLEESDARKAREKIIKAIDQTV